MMIRLKQGVNPFAMRPELLLALINMSEIYHRRGWDLTVTSINDGIHSRSSLHYNGQAADIRTKNIPDATQAAMVKELRESLGMNPDYDIVREDDHIHIEYQPKYRGVI